MLHGMQDLSSQPGVAQSQTQLKRLSSRSRDQTCTPCSGIMETWSLDNQGIPPTQFKKEKCLTPKSWGHKELDTTEQLNWTELNFPLSNDPISFLPLILKFPKREILHIIVIYF